MSTMYRERSPHVREPERHRRLLERAVRAEASVERLPELLPATCPTCRVVLGLVEEGGEVLCRDCGRWVPADDLIVIAEVPA